MAKTVTTTDSGRDFPTVACLQTLAEKVDAHERGAFTVGDALKVKIPQDVAHWRHRTVDGETVKEGEIFADLAALCSRSASTLVHFRNVATTFPKDVRVEGVSFGAHKYLQALAAANNGARRSAIVEWMATNVPTALEAQEHARELRGQKASPTDEVEDGGPAPLSAADVVGPVATSITGDDLLARGIADLAAWDGSMVTEIGAMIRHLEMVRDAFDVVPVSVHNGLIKYA